MKIIFLLAFILIGCYGSGSGEFTNTKSTESNSNSNRHSLQFFIGNNSALTCLNQNENYRCWRGNLNYGTWAPVKSANPLTQGGYSAYKASSDGSMLCGQKDSITRCFPDVLNFDIGYLNGLRNTEFYIEAYEGYFSPQYFSVGAQGNADDIEILSPTRIRSEIFYSVPTRGAIPYYEFRTDLSKVYIDNMSGQINGHMYADKLFPYTKSTKTNYSQSVVYNLRESSYEPNYIVTDQVSSVKWPFYLKVGNIYSLSKEKYSNRINHILHQQSVDTFDVHGNEAGDVQILTFTRNGKYFLSTEPLKSEELSFIPSNWTSIQIFPHDARKRPQTGTPVSSTLVYCGIEISGKPSCLGPKLTRLADGSIKTDFMTIEVPQVPFSLLYLKSYSESVCGFGSEKYTCWTYGDLKVGSNPEEFVLGNLTYIPHAGPAEVYYEFDSSFRLCQGDLKISKNGYNYFAKVLKNQLRISKCRLDGSMDKSYGEITLPLSNFSPGDGSYKINHQAEGNVNWIHMSISNRKTIVLLKMDSEFRSDKSFSKDGLNEYILDNIPMSDILIETIGPIYKVHLNGGYQKAKLILDSSGNLLDIIRD